MRKKCCIVRLKRILDTSKQKVAREIFHQLKLEFYYVDRKMKNVILSNFTSIVLSHNFTYFRVQTGLKYVLEYISLLSENLRIS